ncbi:MFS transporter [Gilvimarinus sp. SDUM040013]|uniref:MFS transporter n=1 Tax=Gilvimarinus gilvus TaxID=3058038 RepID=A0ABU4RY47_9GAMM|nr:MFS transporter [Gilvimarinus sp. SDUM040013]MDO3386183.1 MFS transporter [Gilvimarinus sp. SDUM040013]MDX6849822.1 MFS transporter [Gilvimarinus sp. SDUM040013]
MNNNVNNAQKIRWLTYLMFLMFAMTTDAVGVIIPELMEDFSLSMTQAGLVHYAPMVAIAVAGLGFGFLADRIGRKLTIILGLAVFSVVSFLFLVGDQFGYFLILMVASGIAIGVFKTAALALIGDISLSNREHTRTVNGVEAFFAVGAILGPLLVTYLLSRGVEWKWLYVIAGCLCLLLIVLSLMTKYPPQKQSNAEPVSFTSTLAMLKDPYALGFSVGAFLYVATESAIYVWMPTYIKGYDGPFMLLAVYALTVFFVLRAIGRFLGMWLLGRLNWSFVLVLCSGAIAVCFSVSVLYGKAAAIFLLPLSGLFMSVIYPTLNSKGISCFEPNKHGTAAGVILFFTAAGAAAGPLIMGVVSDVFGGDAKYGFVVATVFALVLFAGLVYNWIKQPVAHRLSSVQWQQTESIE